MKPVSQLYKHNADVGDHSKNHLSNVFGLLFLFGKIADVRDLGESIDKVGYFFAKIGFDRIEIDKRIFNDVVQKSGGYADLVEAHTG